MKSYQKLLVISIIGTSAVSYADSVPESVEQQNLNATDTQVNPQPMTRTVPQRTGAGTSTTGIGGLGGGTSGSTGNGSFNQNGAQGGATSGSTGNGSYNQSGTLGGGSSGSTGTGSFIGANPVPGNDNNRIATTSHQ